MNDGSVASSSLLRRAPRPGTIATVASAMPRRPIVIVLGVHRSGTSLCSHVLSALGVDMVDRVEAPGQDRLVAENPKGHWERWEIVALHDRMLELFGRGYYEPTHDLPLPVAWWAQPRVAELRHEIGGFLETRMNRGLFGFKDPRTLRLMPVWHQIFDELKLAPKIVFCLRNPAEVARSLQARDGLDPDIGELRWFTYTTDFFRYVKDADICAIEYEAWFDDPSANLTKLRNFLDLSWHQSEFELEATISGILDPELRHDDPAGREARQPLVRSLYKLALRAEQDASAREQIQRMAAQFISFQQLQAGLQRGFEHTLARLPASAQEAAEARAALDAKEADLRAADSRLEDSEAREAEARAQVARQIDQLADLTRERDEARQALAAMQAEWERDGSPAKMRTDITMLRETVSRAERQLAQDAQDAARIRAEIAELHQKIEQAMRTAEDGAALIKTMEAEIASLENALTVARQVGRVALDALAVKDSTSVPVKQSAGWRKVFRRFLNATVPSARPDDAVQEPASQ